MARNALLFRPKIIVAGISCYSRNLDYARFRQIANSCGALLMADMAHISGLVAAGKRKTCLIMNKLYKIKNMIIEPVNNLKLNTSLPL